MCWQRGIPLSLQLLHYYTTKWSGENTMCMLLMAIDQQPAVNNKWSQLIRKHNTKDTLRKVALCLSYKCKVSVSLALQSKKMAYIWMQINGNVAFLISGQKWKVMWPAQNLTIWIHVTPRMFTAANIVSLMNIFSSSSHNVHSLHL